MLDTLNTGIILLPAGLGVDMLKPCYVDWKVLRELVMLLMMLRELEFIGRMLVTPAWLISWNLPATSSVRELNSLSP